MLLLVVVLLPSLLVQLLLLFLALLHELAERHAFDRRARRAPEPTFAVIWITHVSSENPTATSRGTPNASCSANTQPACQVPRNPGACGSEHERRDDHDGHERPGQQRDLHVEREERERT